MTRVLWRQYRDTALVFGGVLLLAVIFLLVSGFHLISLAQQLKIAACAHQDTDYCVQIMGTFQSRIIYEQLLASLLLFLLPLLVGLFVGAPLIAREWEQGTYRLAWTQSVSRSRWLANRLSVLILVILPAFIILALLGFWWYSPQISISNVWVAYEAGGGMPVTYALFAFALGTVSGALFRKTLPAMAVTLFLFLLIHISIAIWLRPYFLPPLVSATFNATQPSPTQVQQSLRVHFQYIDRQGHLLSAEEAFDPCNGKNERLDQCLNDRGIRYYVLYQPADRFWLFQGIEAILYLVLILGLLGLTFWLVRRRLC